MTTSQAQTQTNEPMELDDLDETYASAQAEKRSGPPDPVPDGKYQTRITKAWLARAGEKAKNPGARMLRWELTVLGPNFAGRKLFRNNMIETPENVKWLKTDLHTCGLDLAKLSDLPQHVADLLNVCVEVQVKNQGVNAQGLANQAVYINRRIELALGAGTAVAMGNGNGAKTSSDAPQPDYDDDVPF